MKTMFLPAHEHVEDRLQEMHFFLVRSTHYADKLCAHGFSSPHPPPPNAHWQAHTSQHAYTQHVPTHTCTCTTCTQTHARVHITQTDVFGDLSGCQGRKEYVFPTTFEKFCRVAAYTDTAACSPTVAIQGFMNE